MTGTKQIIIIAGPNGAGKTTFAMEFLPNEANCPIFVNADLMTTRAAIPYSWRRQVANVFRLPTPEAATKRVAQRVAEGGHDVPEPVIRRRFDAGWRNFNRTYRDLVDDWFVYDNSGRNPVLLAEAGR